MRFVDFFFLKQKQYIIRYEFNLVLSINHLQTLAESLCKVGGVL